MFVNDAQVTKPNLLTTTGVVNAIDQGLVGSLFACSHAESELVIGS